MGKNFSRDPAESEEDPLAGPSTGGFRAPTITVDRAELEEAVRELERAAAVPTTGDAGLLSVKRDIAAAADGLRRVLDESRRG